MHGEGKLKEEGEGELREGELDEERVAHEGDLDGERVHEGKLDGEREVHEGELAGEWGVHEEGELLHGRR